jgi:hypothetical protein
MRVKTYSVPTSLLIPVDLKEWYEIESKRLNISSAELMRSAMKIYKAKAEMKTIVVAETETPNL